MIKARFGAHENPTTHSESRLSVARMARALVMGRAARNGASGPVIESSWPRSRCVESKGFMSRVTRPPAIGCIDSLSLNETGLNQGTWAAAW